MKNKIFAIVKKLIKLCNHVIYSIGYVLFIESRNRYDNTDLNDIDK